MAVILLTNPPCSLSERYGALAAAGSTLPQLGLASLAAVLRQDGHRVTVCDCSAAGVSLEDLARLAQRVRPDVLGVSAVTFTVARAAEAARTVKRALPGVVAVLGGPHATALPEETLAAFPEFDLIVRGEGEETIKDLLSALAAGRNAEAVEGLALRKDGKVLRTPDRAPVSRLDALPFPAWDLLPGFPRRYRPALFRYRRLPAAHAVTSRGCPHACVFCDCAVFGRKVRAHSAQYMAAYAEHLSRSFAVREIAFEDDQFLFSKTRAEEFCRRLLQKNPGLLFSANCRADAVDDLALLRLLRRAGFRQVSLGVESGDPDVLSRSGKGLALPAVAQAVGLLRRADIEARGFFVLGLPGETEKSLEATRRFIKKTPFSDINVFLCTPFPGSALYAELRAQGAPLPEFSAMNTVSPAFLPEGMTAQRLARARAKLLREFYCRPGTAAAHAARLAASPGALLRAAQTATALLK
ncbi:MAG: radical SAM protein [Thermodesulfobacteriota bacterium]